MTPIAVFAGVMVLTGVAIFTYFGSYWYQFLKQRREWREWHVEAGRER